jgi:hypothetical protein
LLTAADFVGGDRHSRRLCFKRKPWLPQNPMLSVKLKNCFYAQKEESTKLNSTVRNAGRLRDMIISSERTFFLTALIEGGALGGAVSFVCKRRAGR